MQRKNDKFSIFLSDDNLPIYMKQDFVKDKTMKDIELNYYKKKNYTLGIRTPTFISLIDPNVVVSEKYPNILHKKKYDFSYAFQWISNNDINTIRFIFQCQVDNCLGDSTTPIKMPNFLVKFNLSEFETKTTKEILQKISFNLRLSHENPELFINDKLIDVDNDKPNEIFQLLKNDQNQNIFKCHLTKKALKTIERRSFYIQKLKESEIEYIERLNYIFNYVIPRIKKSDCFDEQKINSIVDSLRKIFKYHTNFYIFGLAKLNVGYSNNVSKIFFRLGDSSSINHDYNIQYVNIFLIKPEIKNVKEIDKSFFMAKKVDINEIVDATSNRLLNYTLFIKEILNNTPKSHFDYEFLRIAEWKMKSIFAEIDFFFYKQRNGHLINGILKRIENSSRFFDPNKMSLNSSFDIFVTSKKELILKKPGKLYLFHNRLFLTIYENKEKSDKEKVLFFNKIKNQSFVCFPDNKLESILFFANKVHNYIVDFDSKKIKDNFIVNFKMIRKNLLHYKPYKIIAQEVIPKAPILPTSFGVSACNSTDTTAYFSGGFTEGKSGNCSPLILFNSKDNEISVESNIGSSTPSPEMRMAKGESSLYLFGGKSCRTVMKLIDKKWTELPGNSSFTRVKHSMVYFNGYLAVYGGLDEKDLPTTELWLYDLKSNSWNRPIIRSSIPPPRFDHSAVVYRNVMIVHGGQFNGEKLNDTWMFDFSKMCWKQIVCGDDQQLVKRSGHAALVVNQFMVVIGGDGYNNSPFAMNIETREVARLKISGNFVQGMNEFTAAPMKNESNEIEIFCFGGYNNDHSVILNSLTKLSLPEEITKPDCIASNNEINF